MILIGRADEDELLNLIGEKKGSIVSYFGYVREESNGRIVRGMMCRKREDSHQIMERIEREIRERFPVENVILYHTVGDVKVGGLLAAVLVSTVHRDEGFSACRYGIDRIKELEPVDREEY